MSYLSVNMTLYVQHILMSHCKHNDNHYDDAETVHYMTKPSTTSSTNLNLNLSRTLKLSFSFFFLSHTHILYSNHRGNKSDVMGDFSRLKSCAFVFPLKLTRRVGPPLITLIYMNSVTPIL